MVSCQVSGCSAAGHVIENSGDRFKKVSYRLQESGWALLYIIPTLFAYVLACHPYILLRFLSCVSVLFFDQLQLDLSLRRINFKRH